MVVPGIPHCDIVTTKGSEVETIKQREEKATVWAPVSLVAS